MYNPMVVDTEPTQHEIDRIFSALADATRRDILVRVIDREQSVSSLARPYAMSLPAVQKHVGVLERAGLVGKSRVGTRAAGARRAGADQDRARAARAVRDALARTVIATMDRLLAEDGGLRARREKE